MKGLTAAANLQQQSVEASTLQTSYDRAGRMAAKRQCGSATKTGEHIAAPSSLAGIKSHLATEFELLGHTEDRDPSTEQGNPMHSMQIRGLLRDYSHHTAEAGYEKKAAVPLTDSESEAEMHLLLSSMYNSSASAHKAHSRLKCCKMAWYSACCGRHAS